MNPRSRSHAGSAARRSRVSGASASVVGPTDRTALPRRGTSLALAVPFRHALNDNPKQTLSRHHRSLLLAALFAVAACDGANAPGEAAAEVAEAIEPVDPALVAVLPQGSTEEMLRQGRELYVVCSVCHGLDGRGTQLGPSLRDTTWIHIAGEIPEIAEITRGGVARPEEFPVPMPVMGGGDFDEDQLRAIATYVYALARSSG